MFPLNDPAYGDAAPAAAVNRAPKRLVPGPDESERELATRDIMLIGDALDAMDRDAPVWAAGAAGVRWHADWSRARRAYVTGDPGALERMLDYVTLANPPLAGDECRTLPAHPKARLVSWDDFAITIRIRRPVFRPPLVMVALAGIVTFLACLVITAIFPAVQ